MLYIQWPSDPSTKENENPSLMNLCVSRNSAPAIPVAETTAPPTSSDFDRSLCNFRAVTRNECPPSWVVLNLSNCWDGMSDGELCQADMPLPNGETNYKVNNCGPQMRQDVFVYECTSVPSLSPSSQPTTSYPSFSPTTSYPSHSPTTSYPSRSPTTTPSLSPTSQAPTHAPTHAPTQLPSLSPTSQSEAQHCPRSHCWETCQSVRIVPGSRYSGEANGTCGFTQGSICDGNGYTKVDFGNGFQNSFEWEDLEYCPGTEPAKSGSAGLVFLMIPLAIAVCLGILFNNVFTKLIKNPNRKELDQKSKSKRTPELTVHDLV